MQKQIILNGFNKPRIKPTYGELPEGSRLYVCPLADDFKQEIRNRVIVEIQKQTGKFPISGNVSVYLTVTTSRRINLFGVLKNVLDGMNRLVYTDDCTISSVLAVKHLSDVTEDELTIRILNGVRLRGIAVEEATLDPFTVLNVKMRTLVVGEYFGYPPASECSEVIVDNADSLLRQAITEEWSDTETVNWGDAVSVSVETSCLRPDIDNIAANYLVNLSGLAYEGLNDLNMIHMEVRRKQRSKEKAIIKVFGNR